MNQVIAFTGRKELKVPSDPYQGLNIISAFTELQEFLASSIRINPISITAYGEALILVYQDTTPL